MEIELTLKSSKKLMKAIRFLTQRSDEIMASVKDVQDAIVAEKAQVQTRLDELAAAMQSLKDQVAAGAAATPEQLDELKMAVESIFTPAPVDAPVETPVVDEPIVDEPVDETPAEEVPAETPVDAPVEAPVEGDAPVEPVTLGGGGTAV